MRHPPLKMLKTIFANYPGIRAVYLFGSSASGRAHAESDLDLAVLADDTRLRSRKVDILAKLAASGFCDVDLVFLPDDEFLSNAEHYGSAERFLHLAIEALLDMGNHVIADENWGVVNWYSDVPKIFAGRGLISSDVCEKWIHMIGFRNTLVHDYIDIDRTIVLIYCRSAFTLSCLTSAASGGNVSRPYPAPPAPQGSRVSPM